MRWLELMCIEDIIIEIITELTKQETSVSVTGGKGYAAGKVYPSSPVGVLTLLGSEENEEQKEYKFKPVKISKAFKKGR